MKALKNILMILESAGKVLEFCFVSKRVGTLLNTQHQHLTRTVHSTVVEQNRLYGDSFMAEW